MQNQRIKYHQDMVNELDKNSKPASQTTAFDKDFEAKIKQLEQNKNENQGN